ncbi:MAG: nucleotidyltransferase domain-containing protein [Thermofilum sp.]
MASLVDEHSLRLLKAIKESGRARFKELRAVVPNPKTLSSRLKLLSKLGLVERDGSSYSLTELGEKALEKLAEVEELLRSRPKIQNVERIPHAYYAPLIRRFCEKLYEALGERLVSVVLFGSVARGNWSKDSDIDLLVVAEGWESKPVWERLRELRKAEKELEASPEYLKAIEAGYMPVIQPHPLSKDEAREFRTAYLDLVLEGIVLYDKESFISEVLRSVKQKLEKAGAVRVTLPSGQYYWILGGEKVVKLG